eukprot:scaffold51246_cov22-Tisochrysis_lutea.AAC.3
MRTPWVGHIHQYAPCLASSITNPPPSSGEDIVGAGVRLSKDSPKRSTLELNLRPTVNTNANSGPHRPIHGRSKQRCLLALRMASSLCSAFSLHVHAWCRAFVSTHSMRHHQRNRSQQSVACTGNKHLENLENTWRVLCCV